MRESSKEAGVLKHPYFHSSVGDITFDAFVAALFGSYTAIMFSSTNSLSNSALAAGGTGYAVLLGNILAIVAAGFIGPKANARQLFFLGLVVASASVVTQLSSELISNQLLYVLKTFLSCGASAILVLAWCERIAGKSMADRLPFLALYSLFAVCVVLLSIQIPETWLPKFTSVLLVVSAFASFILARKSPDENTFAEQKKFPLYVLCTIFVFGFMIGLLSLISIRMNVAQGTPIPTEARFDTFTLIWTIIAFVVTALVWIMFLKRKQTLLMAVFIPLLCLGLLIPPFIHSNNESTSILSAIITFLVVCEMIVCSIGPSDVKRVFHFGGITFVFWDRSSTLIGLVAGIAVAMILMQHPDIAYEGDLVFAVFVIYGILSLTVATLLGVMNARSVLLQKTTGESLQESCKAVSEKYGLTPREAEVFELVAQGRSLPYVQEELHIASGTATTHIKHIYQKLGIHNKQELLDLVQNIERQQ